MIAVVGMARRPDGGSGEHLDGFDAELFGMPAEEAAAMGPRQRLALELAWEGLETAAIAGEEAASGPVGIFLGSAGGGDEDAGASGGQVARSLRLSGPAETVDGGRSPVLLACESLRAGGCALALAGCVDEDAGIVVLKRLDEALRDGDRVHAVIRDDGTDAAGEHGAAGVGEVIEAALRIGRGEPAGDGTGALLAEPPATTGDDLAQEPPVVPFVFSAQAEEALEQQLEWNVDGPDAAYTLARRRQLEHRAVRVGDEVIKGRVAEGGTAFMFTGQGAQRAGMGSELYEAYPVFAAAFDAACDALRLDRSVFDDAELLQRTQYTQTSLFALEVALFRLTESFGLEPDYLIGHSIGEISAAHVAGVMSLEDAAKLVSARGRLMGELPEGGVMIAVRASEEEVLGVLPEGLEIAAVNAEQAVVVAGDDVEFEVPWKTTRLRVSHAFHSHRMEPMLDEFRAVAASLDYAEPRIPIVSAQSGFDAEHWVRHVREPVRFADGVRALREAGVARFLELGPDGILSNLAGSGVAALRRRRPEAETFVKMLAHAWVTGAEVDWGLRGRVVDLPAYPFQRRSLTREVA